MKIGIDDVVDGKRMCLRVKQVLFDGIDITHKCYFADDIEGKVGCYKVDAEGKFYLEKDKNGMAINEAAVETLYGKVEIVLSQEAVE